MPLPIILGIGAVVAGVAGVGSGIHGAKKMKDANDTMKSAQSRNDKNVKKLKEHQQTATKEMDKLGEKELEILKGFEEFSDTIEKIQNRPEFRKYQKDGAEIPQYDPDKIKEVSIGAGVLLGGLGGVAMGAAGGFAAAGATTAAVMALGTASTGTAIASLSGAAATNATLAALGGGAVAAGGGGMALGATILGAATLGIGLLVGGAIFDVTGRKLSGKADEAWSQMMEAESKITTLCEYLDCLGDAAKGYLENICIAHKKYQENFQYVSNAVNGMNKTDWNDFTKQERIATENAVLLVGLLYKMCQVSIVNRSDKEDGVNMVNKSGMNEAIRLARHISDELKSA